MMSSSRSIPVLFCFLSFFFSLGLVDVSCGPLRLFIYIFSLHRLRQLAPLPQTRQKLAMSEALEHANHFQNTAHEPQAHECELAIKRVVFKMQLLDRVWKVRSSHRIRFCLACFLFFRRGRTAVPLESA